MLNHSNLASEQTFQSLLALFFPSRPKEQGQFVEQCSNEG
jgi:hypothetical protein